MVYRDTARLLPKFFSLDGRKLEMTNQSRLAAMKIYLIALLSFCVVATSSLAASSQRKIRISAYLSGETIRAKLLTYTPIGTDLSRALIFLDKELECDPRRKNVQVAIAGGFLRQDPNAPIIVANIPAIKEVRDDRGASKTATIGTKSVRADMRSQGSP